MLRKILTDLLVLGLIFTLCGCKLFTADTAELLSPPELAGDMKPINDAIRKSVKTDYSPEYPSRGDYRSAVVLQDINKDGVLEAFSFYSTQSSDTTVMHINVIKRNDTKEWESVADQSINAGGVDRIDFCDLDSDGIDEILVGWEIYGTSELQLAVYSLQGGSLKEMLLTQYTHYVTCDLNKDDSSEILIVRAQPSASKNTAHLFTLTEGELREATGCDLDSSAKTLNHPVVSTLSNGEPAVYVDEIKGVGAVTEVLYLQKGRLVNPLLGDTKETTATLRSATLEIKDINDDGILEIPVQQEVPSLSSDSGEEKQYLINWCSYTGEALTVQMTSVTNVSDGFYYQIPKKWIGSIALLRDTASSLTEIYRYDSEKGEPKERLIYFKAVPKEDWDSGKYKNQALTEIVNNGGVSYICCISDSAIADGVNLEKIKTDFKLY